MESLVEDASPLRAAHLEALTILLVERNVDVHALRGQVLTTDADAVAPTPTTNVSMAKAGRMARTLKYQLYGQGTDTSVSGGPLR